MGRSTPPLSHRNQVPPNRRDLLVMGRRALPKLDPELDLANYYLELEQTPRPLTARALFGRDAPLEVEMGSGKGLFLASSAAAHPERCYVGIEIAHKYSRHAAARLAKRELTNAK